MPVLSKNKGFTLIELLIVITIIGILAGILIMVLNPDRYLGDSRNARRRIELHTISMAVYQYAVSHGSLPPTITDTETEICREGGNCAGLVDLSALLFQTEYLTTIPVDPKCANEDSSCYAIYSTANGRVTVSAPLAENGEVIEVTR